jgi:dihydrofolate reductase
MTVMRKVKLQMQISVDGFVAARDGALDWLMSDWDHVLNRYAKELVDSSDTLLIGTATYEGMAAYWPTVVANLGADEYDTAFGCTMNEIDKVVFSNSLKSLEWKNSRLAKRPIKEEVLDLKQKQGKDMMIYGGARIVSSFIMENLVDEYHFFVNPVMLASGIPIFNRLHSRRKLKHVKTTTSSRGIVILCYESAAR